MRDTTFPTICGAKVFAHRIAIHPHQVTCAACLENLDEYNQRKRTAIL